MSFWSSSEFHPFLNQLIQAEALWQYVNGQALNATDRQELLQQEIPLTLWNFRLPHHNQTPFHRFWERCSDKERQTYNLDGMKSDPMLLWRACNQQLELKAIQPLITPENVTFIYDTDTPLLRQMYRGENLAVTQALVAAGSNLHHRDGQGFTPFHYACFGGYSLASIQAVMDDDTASWVNNRATNQFKHTPLMLTLGSKEGDLVVARFLLDQGADVTLLDAASASALYYYCASNQPQDLELEWLKLLTRPALLNQPVKKEKLPEAMVRTFYNSVMEACFRGCDLQPEVGAFLLQESPVQQWGSRTALHLACKYQVSLTVLQDLYRPEWLNLAFENQTPLELEIKNGCRYPVIDFLMMEGAQVTKRIEKFAREKENLKLLTALGLMEERSPTTKTWWPWSKAKNFLLNSDITLSDCKQD